jgi:predicted dehydrogenase
VTVRVGIVGLGKIAGTHARALAAVPHVSVVAGADVRPDAALLFRDRSLPVYRSAEELCRRHELDAVVVGTPTATHAEVCAALIRLGRVRRVLVEKPLAARAEDVRDLLSEARRRSVALEVLYHFRFAPEVLWATSRLAAWLELHGPVAGLRSFFSDPYARIARGEERFVSSWVDSGINVLSMLDRFVELTAVTGVRAVPDLASTYEAGVEFTGDGTPGTGTVFTTWGVGQGTKSTRLWFADGAELLLDHTATFLRLDRHGRTLEARGTDGPVERGLLRYVSLFQETFASDHVPATDRDRRLHRLLFSLDPGPSAARA